MSMYWSDPERAVALFDYAVLHPGGFLLPVAAAELDITDGQIRRAVRDIRRAGPDFGWTVVCEPTGSPGGWRYKLAQIYADAREWVGIRADSVASQLLTLEGALAVTVDHTDGRTTEGRTARRVLRRIRYLREEMQEVEAS